MKPAKSINHIRDRAGQSLANVPTVTINGQSLPCSHSEILFYVDQLLTPREREACDHATD